MSGREEHRRDRGKHPYVVTLWPYRSNPATYGREGVCWHDSADEAKRQHRVDGHTIHVSRYRERETVMAAQWRMMADMLASRLMHHAVCDDHPVNEFDSDCPFCCDRSAYLTYLARGGTVRLPRLDGEMVPVEMVSARVREGEG